MLIDFKARSLRLIAPKSLCRCRQHTIIPFESEVTVTAPKWSVGLFNMIYTHWKPKWSAKLPLENSGSFIPFPARIKPGQQLFSGLVHHPEAFDIRSSRSNPSVPAQGHEFPSGHEYHWLSLILISYVSDPFSSCVSGALKDHYRNSSQDWLSLIIIDLVFLTSKLFEENS